MIQASSHQPIQLDEVFEALKQPLAFIPDSERRDELQRFLDAARLHQERAIVDLISDIIARINEAAPETRVRLDYQQRQFHLAIDSNAPAEEPSDPMLRMDGDLDKVTIRLPQTLKDYIDQVAGERGMSLNSWYVRALARAAAHQMRGHRAEDGNRGGHMGWPGRRGGRRRREGMPGASTDAD